MVKTPVYYLSSEPVPDVAKEETAVPLEAKDFMMHKHILEIIKLLKIRR